MEINYNNKLYITVRYGINIKKNMKLEIAAKLEESFARVQRDKMQGMPVINDKLKIEAIDFQVWNEFTLGVLITPWFMNFILVPNDKDTKYKMGEQIKFNFPAGDYVFLVNITDDIGTFLTCSIFSPMFEFENQKAARAAARSSLEYLLQPPAAEQEKTLKAESQLKGKISRRELIRGKLFKGYSS